MKQPAPATTPTLRDVYTVSRLNREAKAVLEVGFPPLWIEGEISNLSRPASGHVYFSLKDAQAQVRCAFFRQHQRLLGLALRDGLHVLARARVSLYEGRGDYQLIIEYLEEAGEGALRRAFDGSSSGCRRKVCSTWRTRSPYPNSRDVSASSPPLRARCCMTS